MIREVHRIKPFPHGVTNDFIRADLEIYGIDHFRPSYNAWVFFSDDQVDESNAHPSRSSFAGTFAVFGHTDCWGGAGHCQATRLPRRFDLRPSDALTPAFRRVIVTPALRRAVAAGKNISITIVATCREPWSPEAGTKLFKYAAMQLTTFG